MIRNIKVEDAPALEHICKTALGHETTSAHLKAGRSSGQTGICVYSKGNLVPETGDIELPEFDRDAFEKRTNDMKTLIVYYSLEGNTDYVAGKIAGSCGFDILRLVTVKQYPTGGFKKFLWGGKSAVMAEKPALEPYSFESDKYDRILFGFPVWAGNVAPPIRTFIRDNDLSGKRIAAFACQSGSGAEKAFGKLKAALGIDALEAELILIDPKAKPNADNDTRINEFCGKLMKE